MPSLPRIRRHPSGTRPAGDVVERPRSRLAELHAHGLTWIHLDAPNLEESSALAQRFDWHALDIEDVLSKRQRPKIDDYPEYLFAVLHFPVYDKAIQRLNAAELDCFLGPNFVLTRRSTCTPTASHRRRTSRVRPSERVTSSSHRRLPSGRASVRTACTGPSSSSTPAWMVRAAWGASPRTVATYVRSMPRLG